MDEYEGEVVCKVKDANKNETNNKKGGRPRIDESEKRKVNVAMSFTEEEYGIIKDLSDALGCRPAELLRYMYFSICEENEFVIRIDKTTNSNLKNEVSRIINLLEQSITIVKLGSREVKELELIENSMIELKSKACKIDAYLALA